MNGKSIDIRYATLKRVQKFFGTKATAINFPTDINLKDPDEKLFAQAVKALINGTPNSKGEVIEKPTFSFGRVLLKYSKNAGNFALSQCTIYITEYDYNDEKRVQVVIAPPIENDYEDVDNLDFLGTKPATTDDEDEDTEDEDTEDEDEEDEDEDDDTKDKKTASKNKSRK